MPLVLDNAVPRLVPCSSLVVACARSASLTQPRPDSARVGHVRTAHLDVLLVDDDESTQSAVGKLLNAAGHRVTVTAHSAEALAIARERVFDIAICDIGSQKPEGLRFFRRLRRDAPATAVILTTGCGAVPEAVEALHCGACDYLTKPFDPEALGRHVDRIAEHLALKRPLEQLQAQVVSRVAGGTIVGDSPAIVRLRTRVDAFAPSDAPVVVSGEIGTGKELVARTIHARGPRRNHPFRIVDCSMPAAQLESELFGEPGDGASHAGAHDGAFQMTHGGTLLLGNVDAAPMSIQARLRRVLKTRAIEPSGGGRSVPVDVRIVGATRCTLDELAGAGRSDRGLWSDLKILELTTPPLRDRRGDIALLAAHFLRQWAHSEVDPCRLSRNALRAITTYSYPGNVRELIHALQRAWSLARGNEIDLDHLPPEMSSEKADAVAPLSDAAREFEGAYLRSAVGTCNPAALAQRLGLSRATLRSKLRRHGISDAGAERQG